MFWTFSMKEGSIIHCTYDQPFRVCFYCRETLSFCRVFYIHFLSPLKYQLSILCLLMSSCCCLRCNWTCSLFPSNHSINRCTKFTWYTIRFEHRSYNLKLQVLSAKFTSLLISKFPIFWNFKRHVSQHDFFFASF